MVPERSDDDPGPIIPSIKGRSTMSFPEDLPPMTHSQFTDFVNQLNRRVATLEAAILHPNDPEAIKMLDATFRRRIVEEIEKTLTTEFMTRRLGSYRRPDPSSSASMRDDLRPTTSFSTEQVERALEDWFGPHGLNRDSPNYTMNMQKMRRVLTNFLGSLQ